MATVNLKVSSTGFDITSDAPGTVPVVSSGSPWVVGYDLDFSAQSTLALGSDTTYTIDGKTWTKQNSTHDNTAMALTNAAGLVIIPKGDGSDYTTSTRTIPLICLPLSSAIPSFDLYTMAVRAWIYTSSTNFAANYDSVCVALDTGTTDMGYILKNGYNTSGQGQGKYLGVLGAAPNGYANQTSNVTDNVHCVEATYGLLGCHMKSYGGTYSAGWPAISAMHKAQTVRINGNLATQAAEAGTWYVSIGGQRVSSATALSVTIARMKVEYRYL